MCARLQGVEIDASFLLELELVFRFFLRELALELRFLFLGRGAGGEEEGEGEGGGDGKFHRRRLDGQYFH